MIKFISVIFIIFLISCSTNSTNNVEAEAEIESQKISSITPSKNTIKPGEARLIKIPFPKEYEVKKLICNKKEFMTAHSNGHLKAFVAIPLRTKLRPFECNLTYISPEGEQNKTIAYFDVIKKIFDSEKLNVPKKTIDLSKKDLARYFKEKKIIKKVYANPNKTPLFRTPFVRPLNSFITSNFGRKRVYNNKKENQHGGVDLRAKINTPIPAANSGKVVLAMDLFFSGNTVLIDHGMGIFTMYAHLNKIKAQVGEYVPLGAIIGLSGMTGRVSGPHLHWGVKISGVNVDGLNFLKEGI